MSGTGSFLAGGRPGSRARGGPDVTDQDHADCRHSDFKTTERYIDLAGVVFADEVKLLGDWCGATGTKNRYYVAVDGSGYPSGIAAGSG